MGIVECPIPAPVPEDGCLSCMECNTGFWNNDIAGGGYTYTPAACDYRCHQTPRCGAWSWGNPNYLEPPESRKCRLKSRKGRDVRRTPAWHSAERTDCQPNLRGI